MNIFADAYAQRALVEVVIVGVLCGLVGVHVVLRRLAFFTMAMTHATFPGVVLAAVLGLNLYLGSAAFGLLVVVAVAWLSSRPGADGSTVVGVVLSAGFALGVVLLSAQSGFTRDLSAFLVGSVLTVSAGDLLVGAVMTAVVALVLAGLSKELLLGAFDRGGLVSLGYPAGLLEVAMLVLIELTVVTAVPAVGTIMAVALIVAPAATARLWCDRVATMTAMSVGLAVGSGVVGLAISQLVDVAAGAAIVLVACAAFGVSWLFAPRYGTLTRRVSASVA
jgi:ABC-type Mn2+/Zn2+ transport system permease subunit